MSGTGLDAVCRALNERAIQLASEVLEDPYDTDGDGKLDEADVLQALALDLAAGRTVLSSTLPGPARGTNAASRLLCRLQWYSKRQEE